MRKYLNVLMLSILILLLSTATLAAPPPLAGYTPFAYERITVTNAAIVRLNAVNRELSGAVFITIETNNIRYRIDSGDPSAAVNGHLVVAASYQNLWFVDSYSIREFRAIATGANAFLIVTYYRRI